MDWYSSSESSFGADVGAPPGAGFAVNVFLRDGDTVYRTWHTNGRGTEQLSYTFALIDILPWGRQEEWQDSPDGWPQSPTYSNWLDSPDVARLYGPQVMATKPSRSGHLPINGLSLYHEVHGELGESKTSPLLLIPGAFMATDSMTVVGVGLRGRARRDRLRSARARPHPGHAARDVATSSSPTMPRRCCAR